MKNDNSLINLLITNIPEFKDFIFTRLNDEQRLVETYVLIQFGVYVQHVYEFYKGIDRNNIHFSNIQEIMRRISSTIETILASGLMNDHDIQLFIMTLYGKPSLYYYEIKKYLGNLMISLLTKKEQESPTYIDTILFRYMTDLKDTWWKED